MQSGNPGKGNWYGKDSNGNDVTTLNNGTRDRGIAVLGMYIRQGGRDAYGDSKRVLSPADFDVEHIRPASKGGLDHPSNWILARSGAQRQRADEELGKWIDKLPDPGNKTAMNKYYSDFAKDQQRKNAAKAIIAMLIAFIILIHIPQSIGYHKTEHADFLLSIARIPMQFLLIGWAWLFTKNQ
jgi:hypothetical protein